LQVFSCDHTVSRSCLVYSISVNQGLPNRRRVLATAKGKRDGDQDEQQRGKHDGRRSAYVFREWGIHVHTRSIAATVTMAMIATAVAQTNSTNQSFGVTNSGACALRSSSVFN
jgi:hypothetical protein